MCLFQRNLLKTSLALVGTVINFFNCQGYSELRSTADRTLLLILCLLLLVNVPLIQMYTCVYIHTTCTAGKGIHLKLNFFQAVSFHLVFK